jgi:hypothetical protein
MMTQNTYTAAVKIKGFYNKKTVIMMTQNTYTAAVRIKVHNTPTQRQ